MKPVARSASLAAWVALVALAGCAGGPPTPDWQVEAHAGLERSTQAWLRGDHRVEALEFTRARAQIASTARTDLVARAELLRCATRIASLVMEPCAGYAPLAADAAPPEQAYARYLAGEATAQDAALLPPAQRPFVSAAATGAALAAVEDPLGRLVAAGVLLRTGRADPTVIEQAVRTASEQGWRRPLLAWLGVQAQRAEQAGDRDAAERIRRRMALVTAPG